MKHHSKKTTRNIHSKDSYSAVNSPHMNTFWKHFHRQKSVSNRVWKHCFHTANLARPWQHEITQHLRLVNPFQ